MMHRDLLNRGARSRLGAEMASPDVAGVLPEQGDDTAQPAGDDRAGPDQGADTGTPKEQI
eukprot:1769908-Prorocentrum_lima.AAC.1